MNQFMSPKTIEFVMQIIAKSDIMRYLADSYSRIATTVIRMFPHDIVLDKTKFDVIDSFDEAEARAWDEVQSR